MPDANDMDLIRQYADSNSETAFAGLVHRHINLVYSVALRFTGNSSDAQDVTQAVFIILAKKTPGLRQRITLTGWLYETTRFTARQLLRTRARQQAREQEAYMQSTLDDSNSENVWRQLSPLLEDAMARLSEKERALVALRFFENKSAAETAVLLGIQESAAHKRTARATEKLRQFFVKRGIALTAAAVAGAISANSVQAAPAALSKAVTAAALAKGATASASTLTLIKGALKIMAWTKVKTAVVVGLSVILTASVTPHVWYYHLGPNAWQHRFEAAYRLKDGQVLKYTAPVRYIPERAQFYLLNYPQHGEIPPGCSYSQNGQEIDFAGGMGGKSISLHDTLCYLFKFSPNEIEGPNSLMFLNVTGDWTIRDGTSRESLLAAVEPILARITGHNIRFQKQSVERDAIVAHGTPGNHPDDFKIQVYSEDPNSDLVGGGNGDMKQFLESVADRVRVQFIDETSEDARSMQGNTFRWDIHLDTESQRMGARRAALTDKVLKNISAQTGLSFTHEKRAVKIWTVTEQP